MNNFKLKKENDLLQIYRDGNWENYLEAKSDESNRLNQLGKLLGHFEGYFPEIFNNNYGEIDYSDSLDKKDLLSDPKIDELIILSKGMFKSSIAQKRYKEYVKDFGKDWSDEVRDFFLKYIGVGYEPSTYKTTLQEAIDDGNVVVARYIISKVIQKRPNITFKNNMKELYMSICERLRYIRNTLDYTVKEMSEKTGFTKDQIIAYENGYFFPDEGIDITLLIVYSQFKILTIDEIVGSKSTKLDIKYICQI